MVGLVWEFSLDDIKKIIEKYVSGLGDKLEHIEITWAENESAYFLQVSTEPVKGISPMPGDGLNWGCVSVARINKYKDGDIWPEALDLVQAAGRKLYFELRKSYPVKRDLALQ